MIQNANEHNKVKPMTRWDRVLLYFGIPTIVFAAVLTGRIVWEETALTMQRGPQMIGFSLAHGSGAILLFAPPLLAIWLVVAVLTSIICLWRKRAISKRFWLSVVSAIAVLGILAIPSVFSQWLLIQDFAESRHATELMVSAAAEGDLRTVRGYIDKGVPIEATNYEGSTAAFAAAAGGSAPVIELLAARKANLNATNLYGDSPLEAAIENHHNAAAAFLESHGAVRVRGTPEQRQAASKAIVDKEIEQQMTWY